MYSGAGRIAYAVDDNVSKCFARSFLTPAILAIYPDTFWKSTVPFHEAEALSFTLCLLSPRILLSELGEKLISLSL